MHFEFSPAEPWSIEGPVRAPAGVRRSGGDAVVEEDVWELLAKTRLLSPRLRWWYSNVLDHHSSTVFVAACAAGLLYLAIFPDPAMCWVYGNKLARTICGGASLYMFVGCWRLIGARKVLTCRSMRHHIETVGSMASGLLQFTPFEPNIGHFGEGPAIQRFIKLVVFAIGGSAGLILAGRGASPVARVIWVLTGCAIQLLSLPTLYAARLTQAISKALVVRVLNGVGNFPKDQACSDELFWQSALDDYKELDRKLRELWRIACHVFIPHFLALFVMSVCSIVVSVQAISTHNSGAKALSSVGILWCLKTSLLDLWVLTCITSLCNAKSSFAEDSIFAAAFCKLGRNRMTSQQRKDHWTFLEAVEMSPTGARLFMLVDTALLTRVAVPLLTLDATLISYMLATLDVGGK